MGRPQWRLGIPPDFQGKSKLPWAKAARGFRGASKLYVVPVDFRGSRLPGTSVELPGWLLWGTRGTSKPPSNSMGLS